MKTRLLQLIQSRDLWGIFILIGFWIWVSYPAFGPAFIPTHDGEFHIVRFYEFWKMLVSGNLFPKWAPDLNSGYGLPLFIFHYPFPNYVGVFFHWLGASFIDSFQYGLMSGYLVAILACYASLRKFFTAKIACLSALIFALVPYWFVDLHIRGSIGEVWGIAWIMVTLAAMIWNRSILLSLAVTCLGLSHNIMAMIGVPILLGYAWIFERKQFKYAVLGLFGATYFWLPALLESRFMVGLNTVRFSDHFPSLTQLLIPSWGSVFSQPGQIEQEISQQIGIVPLLLFISGVWLKFRNKVFRDKRWYFWLIVFLLTCLLLLPWSVPIWRILTPLQLLQYPWRLLAVIVISTPFIAGYVLSKLRLSLVVIIMLLAIFLSARYLHPVEYQPRTDQQYLTNREFTQGTSSMGNSFSTVWTGWKRTKPDSRVSVITGKATVLKLYSSLIEDRFTIVVEDNARIAINRLYFPGWKVMVNDQNQPIDYQTNGTLIIDLPKGEYQVLAYFGESMIRNIANLISIVSFVTLIGIGIVRLTSTRTKIRE